MSLSFSAELVFKISIGFFGGVTRATVNSIMLLALGVSASFKGAWGVMEESDVESLFGLAKYELLLNTWVVPYSVLVLASLTG